MKLSRRILALLLLTVLLTVSVTGCKLVDDAQTTTAAPTETTAPPEAAALKLVIDGKAQYTIIRHEKLAADDPQSATAVLSAAKSSS